MSERHDLIFLGAGPGGYHAAVHAAKKGLKVSVVERGELGGTCLNRGCIPTKVLHASAEAYHSAHEGKKFGFTLEGEVSPDFGAISGRKEAIVRKLREGIAALFKGNGITLLQGQGRVAGRSVAVRGPGGAETVHEAANIVVCTGSRPASVPGIDVDHRIVIDSDDMLSMTGVPESIVIVGGGVIGCEFADYLSRFGTKVTIVELLPRILATEDAIASRAVAKSFASRGVEVITGTSVTGIELFEDSASVTLSNGRGIQAARVLVSVGRRPNTEGLGLDELLDRRGFLQVDRSMRTAREGVYAAGDCIGGLMLAHVASKEAEVAVENILGHAATVNYGAIPGCVFTTPEIASAGLSEDEAKKRGIDVVTSRFFYQANGQALALGDDEGVVKVMAGKDGKLLGAVIVGKGASIMIAELALAIAHGMKAADVYEVVHAHPTLPEITMEAVADLDGMAVHKVSPRKRI